MQPKSKYTPGCQVYIPGYDKPAGEVASFVIPSPPRIRVSLDGHYGNGVVGLHPENLERYFSQREIEIIADEIHSDLKEAFTGSFISGSLEYAMQDFCDQKLKQYLLIKRRQPKGGVREFEKGQMEFPF